jgi:hypothetical protein
LIKEIKGWWLWKGRLVDRHKARTVNLSISSRFILLLPFPSSLLSPPSPSLILLSLSLITVLVGFAVLRIAEELPRRSRRGGRALFRL